MGMYGLSYSLPSTPKVTYEVHLQVKLGEPTDCGLLADLFLHVLRMTIL